MVMTKARLQLLQIFKNTNFPVSASDLLKKIKVNKTTIYRELDFLVDKGIVNEVNFGDRKKRFELKDLEHHHHLVCLNCKSVEDVNINESFNVPKSFKVIKHNLEFFGFCASCQ